MSVDPVIVKELVTAGRLFDLILGIAEVFLLWGMVHSWTLFYDEASKSHGGQNGPIQSCTINDIPFTGKIQSARNLIDSNGFGYEGWNFTPVVLPCNRIGHFRISGWAVGGPGNQECQFLENPSLDGRISVTDNSC